MLLYGPPKTGKSTGAASAPGGILYLNTDLENALRFPRSRDTEGRIMEVDYSAGIMQTMIQVALAVQQDQDVIDTVVVDTMNELHRRLLEELSNRAIRPTLNQYGDTAVHIERFCRMLCEADVHAVFVCQEVEVKDEATGVIERLPFMGTGNTAPSSKLLAMVDVIGYTGIAVQDDGQKKYMADPLRRGVWQSRRAVSALPGREQWRVVLQSRRCSVERALA